MEDVKKAIIELLKIRKNHCMTMIDLRRELERKLPKKYPSMVELYKIVKDLELDGKVEFHKAGELYLDGMIPADSVGLAGMSNCIPEGYKVRVEKSGLSEKVLKYVKRIDKEVIEILEHIKEIRKDVMITRQDVDFIKFEFDELYKLLKEKKK